MDPRLAPAPEGELAGVVVPAPVLGQVDRDYDQHRTSAGSAACWSGNDDESGSDDARVAWCRFGVRTWVDDPAQAARVPRGTLHVALVGDSHMRAYLGAFEALADDGRLTFETFFKGNCSWTSLPSTKAASGRPDALTASCERWRAAVQQRLTARPGEYDAVVTSGWSAQRVVWPAGVGATSPAATRARVRLDATMTSWTPVLEAGVPVVAITDNPNLPANPNAFQAVTGTPVGCLTQGAGLLDPSVCAVPRQAALAAYDPLPDAVAAANASVPGRAGLVDLTAFYCGPVTCPVVIGGVNVYRDAHHRTATYALTLAPYLWEQLGPTLTRLTAASTVTAHAPATTVRVTRTQSAAFSGGSSVVVRRSGSGSASATAAASASVTVRSFAPTKESALAAARSAAQARALRSATARATTAATADAQRQAAARASAAARAAWRPAYEAQLARQAAAVGRRTDLSSAGYVSQVLQRVGVRLTGSPAAMAARTTPVSRARVRVGDLVYVRRAGAVTSVRVVVEIRAGRPIARGTTRRGAPVTKAWVPSSGVSFGRVL